MKPLPLRPSELKALSDKNGGKGRFSALDLPIKRQEELAELAGLDFDEWVKKTKQSLKEWRADLDNMKVITFESREEAEKAGYNFDKWKEPLVAVSNTLDY